MNRNPFTNQTVPQEFRDLSGKMVHTIKIDNTQPGYFSHRILTKRMESDTAPDYDPNIDGVGDVSAQNFVEIKDKSDTTLKEIAFLDHMGLIVKTEDDAHYMSPLAAVFYGADGIFEGDFGQTLSTLPNAKERLEFFKPVLGLFANYVLPGRIMRARLVRGALPDTVYEGHQLTEEVRDMQSVLNHIVSLL